MRIIPSEVAPLRGVGKGMMASPGEGIGVRHAPRDAKFPAGDADGRVAKDAAVITRTRYGAEAFVREASRRARAPNKRESRTSPLPDSWPLKREFHETRFAREEGDVSGFEGGIGVFGGVGGDRRAFPDHTGLTCSGTSHDSGQCARIWRGRPRTFLRPDHQREPSRSGCRR